MRRIRGWTMVLLGLSLELGAQAEQYVEIPIQAGEHWWAGVVSESHRMPFTSDAQFAFDFLADTAGNQGQPLLISDQGRSVWCEEPFSFRFGDGAVVVRSQRGLLISGTSGTTLRDVHCHVSQRFFPTAGRIPDAALFSHPQYNTWIELTYNQNQKDLLNCARAAVRNGFPPGVLMIDEGWAKTYGDWDFDRARFEDPTAMMKELHSLGFKVMLWICPYLTPAGSFYKDLWLDHTRKGNTIWIHNANNPSQPIAQRLRDKNHNWEDLRKLVPGIINQGLMGYAFTCPDLIGGGEYLSFLNLDRVDQELIVRAAQCHALMPMMQFSVAPWRVLSPENLDICTRVLAGRF